MSVIAKVWVEPDCITCNACEDICPEVFKVTDDSSMILAEVRADGVFDMNDGAKSPLTGTLGADLADLIVEAAERARSRSSSSNWLKAPLKKRLRPPKPSRLPLPPSRRWRRLPLASRTPWPRSWTAIGP